MRTSTRTPLVSLLLHGEAGTGKTALAATIAQASEFPFVKMITPDNMVGFSEAQKVQAISKVFADSWNSPMSVVIVDNIDYLLGEQNPRRTNLLPPERAEVMNEFVRRLGAFGQTLLQCGAADPQGAHDKASPKGTHSAP